MLGGQFLETLRGRAVGDGLGVAVELGVLDLAEVGPVEQFLEAHHLGAGLGGLTQVLLVEVDHRLLVAGPGRLDHRRPYLVRHRCSPPSISLVASMHASGNGAV